jgi:acetate kinase
VRVLVVNVGSTTLKYDVYEMAGEARLGHGSVALGDARELPAALAQVVDQLELDRLGAVGHRVVHGGERLRQPVRIDAAVEAVIEECAAFAPLHNPACLAGIRAARGRLPGIPHVAVFDTAFHAGMPPHAYRYGLPEALYRDHGIRRYGFHGPAHQGLVLAAAVHLRADPAALRLVTCHLGGGASVAAVERGVSIDTSMGMTPLEGLVMMTRCGDLDPAVPLVLARRGYRAEAIEDLLDRGAGLAGMTGLGHDFQAIERASERGDPRARLAIDVFVHRLRKYVGAYAAELGGADAVVFGGGIGEHSALVRARVCAGLGFMGIALDPDRNAAAGGGEVACVDVSAPDARTRVLVARSDEARMIAREVVRGLAGA